MSSLMALGVATMGLLCLQMLCCVINTLLFKQYFRTILIIPHAIDLDMKSQQSIDLPVSPRFGATQKRVFPTATHEVCYQCSVLEIECLVCRNGL